MPGFNLEFLKRLPSGVHENNDWNGQAEADAHARAEHLYSLPTAPASHSQLAAGGRAGWGPHWPGGLQRTRRLLQVGQRTARAPLPAWQPPLQAVRGPLVAQRPVAAARGLGRAEESPGGPGPPHSHSASPPEHLMESIQTRAKTNTADTVSSSIGSISCTDTLQIPLDLVYTCSTSGS